MADKNTKVKETLELIEQGIKELTSSDKWIEYLKVQSQFRNYSLSNIMLILAQFPKATQVAGFQTWKKLGRYVKKREKGIKILAPIIQKFKKVDVESEEEVEITRVSGFKTVTVFDISQTDGKPLPEVVRNLEGETDLYKKIKSISPVPVYEADEEVCQGANGFYSRENHSITILSSLSEVQKTKTLLHELGHSVLHNKDEVEVPKEVRELEAESVAFIVSHFLGLDTSEFSFGYLAGWANGENAIELIKISAKRIQKASKIILDLIDNANVISDVEGVA